MNEPYGRTNLSHVYQRVLELAWEQFHRNCRDYRARRLYTLPTTIVAPYGFQYILHRQLPIRSATWLQLLIAIHDQYIYIYIATSIRVMMANLIRGFRLYRFDLEISRVFWRNLSTLRWAMAEQERKQRRLIGEEWELVFLCVWIIDGFEEIGDVSE